MLKLTRRSGESVHLYPDYSKVSPTTTLAELFGADGCITITVTSVEHNMVWLGIDALDEFAITRAELDDEVKSES